MKLLTTEQIEEVKKKLLEGLKSDEPTAAEAITCGIGLSKVFDQAALLAEMKKIIHERDTGIPGFGHPSAVTFRDLLAEARKRLEKQT